MPHEPHRQAVAHFERGCVLQRQQQFENAILCYDQALALDPDLAHAHSNRGAALAALNRCDDALSSLERAVALKPDYAEAHFCKAVTLLMQGNLPAGWREFEWRWRTAPGRALRLSRSFSKPAWLGEEDIAGRTLLVHSERGLGDTLQFCRYAPLISQRHAKVVLAVQAPLVALLKSLSAEVRIVSESGTLPEFDFHCPLLSLPLVFKTSLPTIPAPRRYLSADKGAIERVRPIVAARGRPRVGLVWRGDANNPDDRDRSIALSDLLPYLPGEICCFSLQREVTVAERQMIEAHPNFSVAGDAMDFEATAALCECLDLVVAIDTSVAHLGAALGVRTWVLLPFNADCRWLLEREDSPWYPSATLYRQRSRGDWRSVLARLREDLRSLPRVK